MALIAFSASRPGAQEDLLPFERLAVKLSSCFSALRVDEMDDALARGLEEVGAAFSVEECTLIAYDEGESARVVRSWALPPHAPCAEADLARMPWLVQRLARNAVVTITPTSDLPHAAEEDRLQAEHSGVVGRLAVPIVVGARVVYGLIVGSRQRHAEWRVPVIERLRLAGEILGGGLARVRQDEPVSAGADLVDRPGDRPPEADELLDPDAAAIIGESEPLRQALARLKRVAPLDTTVLLLGETGTGKELFARAGHVWSRRGRGPLIRVNCAALPASLIESELFGHERGAFTGAIAARQGRFELADGGTLFLDEIGDLPAELQAKLLRVLQEGEFERVGASKTRRVDVRVIAATHVNLDAAVSEGRFRADLYYRLSVYPIVLPPLRERTEDIPRLVWSFIRRHRRDLSRQVTSVPPEVMRALQQHDWPGNVRELENVLERAMIRSVDGTLQLDDDPGAGARPPAARPAHPDADDQTLDSVQRSHIERVLRECGWRINGAGNAAVRLGLHPNTLRFRIKKLGLELPGRRPGGATRPGAAHPG